MNNQIDPLYGLTMCRPTHIEGVDEFGAVLDFLEDEEVLVDDDSALLGRE